MKAPKIGTIYYSLYVDEETLQHDWDEWHVRTIRGGKVTAIRKDQFTWVKQSKKAGDWGWAKRIHSLWRNTWRQGSDPFGMHTTKLAEIKSVMHYHKDDLKITKKLSLMKSRLRSKK